MSKYRRRSDPLTRGELITAALIVMLSTAIIGAWVYIFETCC